ncbi:hypothetical protein [Lysinibacillus telephonicus]|uniref:hypothetical protein n=1 Tax=Lysinibacillus telephonicus TaxID=1714840 RepID=UPI003BA0E207
MNQIVLPLELEVKLQKNDIAYHVHHLVESIPPEAFEPFVYCIIKVQTSATNLYRV